MYENIKSGIQAISGFFSVRANSEQLLAEEAGVTEEQLARAKQQLEGYGFSTDSLEEHGSIVGLVRAIPIITQFMEHDLPEISAKFCALFSQVPAFSACRIPANISGRGLEARATRRGWHPPQL